ncbi:hypothetical protein UCRPC4_g00871 [Phaeomoniella chlamydospora]|uniref:Uncharacterized protein n=1 Tax=Phaeomoniella chlamydospora TaxID=158046 RepID=A0A0G2GWP5_PHACM|nr:hypothetical protein UCRPC4_g00871 [Phaeomoniella chlamydospora]
MAATISGQDGVQEQDESQPLQWPKACKYFVPETMDCDHVYSLLRSDTRYLEASQRSLQYIDYFGFGDTSGLDHQTLIPGLDRIPQLKELDNPSHRLRMFFIHQKRKYYEFSTSSQLSLTLDTWLKLLDQLQIPPVAVEALHDNNGQCGCHISYCSTDEPHPCRPPIGARCAYHVWMKLGDWGNSEHFAYARHDFHTGRNLVLVLGTMDARSIHQLATKLQCSSRIDFFPALLVLTSSWSREIEEHRWQQDFATQQIESQTGYSSLQFYGIEPLSTKQLSLSKDIAMTSDGISNAVTGALNLADIISFLSAQLRRYADASSVFVEQQVSPEREIQLSDAFSHRLSQVNARIKQMHGLKSRVDAQWKIINALIAQRDSQVNIEIGSATKADSELMRGIAFITMVFLPTTFMATFFSMVFFHVGPEDSIHLIVNHWVWLYPAFTIPLTIVLAFRYGQNTWFETFSRSWANLYPLRPNKRNNSGE